MDGSDGADGGSIKPHCAGIACMDRYVGDQSYVGHHHVRHGTDTFAARLQDCAESSERYPDRWGLTWTFSLPQELAIGVILVGCCPGGTASNVITYLAKGDLALSVGMTAASTMLAPLLTPLLVWLLAGTMVNVHTTGMLLSIVYIVILPIVCGLLCQRFIPKITQRITPYLPAFSSIAVAMTVGIVVAHNADRLMTAGLLVVLVVMLHNMLGLGVGYLVGRLLRLQRAKSVALSIEVGMQNSGLATSLAVMHFAAFPLATIPGAVFSVWHNISGAIIARIYARNKKN